MLQNYKYLQFAPFQSMTEWSVAHLLNRDLGFTKQYPFVRIGDVIQQSAIPVTIKDDVRYKQITLKTNGGGAVLRDVKLGKDIKTKKQYLAKEGQFIMSKIDARNGAFGVVTKELNGAIVTADFPLFNVNTGKISPVYLSLLSATKPFVQYAQSCSNGTTNRQRIDIDSFMAQQIPLPSLDEQNDIIKAYNDALTKANKCRRQAEDIDKQLKAYLQDKLGMEQFSTAQNHDRKGGLMKLIHFKDITRWDKSNVRTINIGTYQSVCLSEIISKLSTGTTPPTGNKEYFEGDIDFYTPSDINGDIYLGDAERHISCKAVCDKKARLFNKGDMLFVGIGSTIGKVGLVAKEKVSANQQITGITFNTQKVLPVYAFVYMHYFRENTTINQSKTTMPIVNQEKISQIPIPLPPIDCQNKIVVHSTLLRTKQKRLLEQAIKLRNKAKIQVEQKIFNQ